ncbi:DNA-processing protein DprA [Candidatus Poriferisocius sp.]|uniref:DNA-processing protein DprA n=1 Tax=Candidatus Poriferisocius sp. TaxID=3101276 RepID=UPI003B5BBC53
MAFELERLGQSGISTLTPFDVRYPKQFVDKLGSKAPSLLYTAGDVDLLGIPAVGVVGSRDVSQEGAAVAEAAAVQAARQHCVLVSGGARGVDQLAMNAAFGAGGAVVGILADSLERNLKFPDVRRAIHYGQALMCSPYNPNAPFRAGNAMGRNKLVYALSDITLVVASDVDKGGTWAGAVEALKSNAGRVGVWRGPGQGPGNEELIERGGLPISSMAELKAAVFERPVVRVEPTYESQGLFL